MLAPDILAGKIEKKQVEEMKVVEQTRKMSLWTEDW